MSYALRTLWRNPGFTTVAVLSLALGIGANTAIFSLIHTVVLSNIPVQDPGSLVEVLHKYGNYPRGNSVSWKNYQDLRDNNHVFSGVIAVSENSLHVRADGQDMEFRDGGYVSGNFFPVLGVKPAIGRLIVPEDDRIGAASPIAVVSWSYWNSRFNLDPAILGKTINVQGASLTVAGVTPRGFFGLQQGLKQDIWLPIAMEPVIRRNTYTAPNGPPWLKLAARLKPGATIEQARAEMKVLFEGSSDPGRPSVEVEPAGAGLARVRDRFAKPLLFLMATVGLLLLIACTNVASMLLARGAAREREMALRVSLGASRWSLVRQVLTESVLLSVAGGLLGVILAYFGADALVGIIASGRERIELSTQVDGVVLLLTAGVALLTGVLFGLVPAVRAFATSPASSMRETGKGGETRFRRLFGKSMVVTQVALSVVLLSAAVLFVGHLSNLKRLDLGFKRDRVLLATLDLTGSGYDAERLLAAYPELLARLAAVPGVRSGTVSAVTPIQGPGAARAATMEGYQAKPGDPQFIAENFVAPKYFETFSTPLLAGRDFTLNDRGGPHVAIVNRTLARYYFGEASPLGKHFTFKDDDKPYEIIGVVGDAKYQEMREATEATIYLNAAQENFAPTQLAIATSVTPSAVASEVRRAVREILKTVAVTRVTTLSDQVDASIVSERLVAQLSGWFGALGAVLAAIGLYGLLAFTVARRTNEIGVRMAFGATPGNVTRMVLGDALGMVCAGLILGSPIAYWAKTYAASVILDLPVDNLFPIVFGAVAMIAVALFAAYVPARRASRVDPMEALRYE